ncbi:MAG: hypothetical protein Q8Q09_15970 [Deltaproteobacteria bacterium]|nr:hypothetical protein [Deltaproteobacteria bacterium]
MAVRPRPPPRPAHARNNPCDFARGLPFAQSLGAPIETPYDTFAKGLIEGALSVGSTVSIERSVTLPTLYSDTVIAPFEDSAALASRGMLGRMGREPCVIEPHAKVPTAYQVDQCLARASMLRAEQNRLRILWVISTGRPRSVITAWGLRESPDWGPGVYLSRITRAKGDRLA